MTTAKAKTVNIKAKVKDLDAEIAADLEESVASIRTVPVKLFGETFRVVTDVNMYLGLALEDLTPTDLYQLMNSLIHEEDREKFHATLRSQRGLNATVLGKIFNGLVEAASERPTNSSPASGTGRSARA